MTSEDFLLIPTPAERDPRYFQTWQRVSLALQKTLRAWVPEMLYRQDPARYEDRGDGRYWVVYEACRAFYGHPRTEFTYDVADPDALPAALRSIGRSMQTVLTRISERLHEAGNHPLARRYGGVWHLDILDTVRKKPKRLIGLLACESALIDAVIDWGALRNAAAAKRFSKALATAARIYGVPLEELRTKVLEETRRVLATQIADSSNDALNCGTPQNGDARTARGPQAGIGG